MPRISVVIPTYDQAPTLRRTLEQLAKQSLPTDEFEVIVADDGSTDDTATVAKSFGDRLRLSYHFQEDRGFRAGAARNAGARLASGDVLVFLDTGALVGPDFVASHLAAHAADPPRGRAVVGYVHAYRHDGEPPAGLREALAELSPVEIRRRYLDDPGFRDMRHDQFAAVDFQLDRRAVPSQLFWSVNCSVRAEDFRAVGGFDEEFVGWGMEDLDLGYRLQQRGVPFTISRDAWAIETPREFDPEAAHESNVRNVLFFLEKYNYREPLLELVVIALAEDDFWGLEGHCRAVLDWADASRELDVRAGLERAVADLPAGARVAVLGCGGAVPDALADAVLVDFDRTLLEAASGDGNRRCHNIGIRTPLDDASVDVVLITSRLDGLWQRWGDLIEEEAARIGREVRRA